MNTIPDGRDVSDFFSKVILKHDVKKAIEKQGGYEVKNSQGKLLGVLIPYEGFVSIKIDNLYSVPSVKSTKSMPVFRRCVFLVQAVLTIFQHCLKEITELFW